MSTQGSSKKARVETSADECQDFKLHLANVPSFALGETHVGKPVYVCKQSDLIISVTKCMIEKRVSSVPVLTEKHNMYYGWIDWVPIVEYVIDHFTKEKANAPEGTAVDQTKTALEMMQESAHFKSLTVHGIHLEALFFEPIFSIFLFCYLCLFFSHSMSKYLKLYVFKFICLQ